VSQPDHREPEVHLEPVLPVSNPVAMDRLELIARALEHPGLKHVAQKALGPGAVAVHCPRVDRSIAATGTAGPRTAVGRTGAPRTGAPRTGTPRTGASRTVARSTDASSEESR
jgi:hypothetical protein